jgi:hypothetical protein
LKRLAILVAPSTGLKAGVNENIDPQVAGLHRRIFGYINGIIIIDEIVPDSAAKDEQRSKKQRGTDRDGAVVKLHGLVLS